MVFAFVVIFNNPVNIGIFISTNPTSINIKRIQLGLRPFDTSLRAFIHHSRMLNAQAVPQGVIDRIFSYFTLITRYRGINISLICFKRWV